MHVRKRRPEERRRDGRTRQEVRRSAGLVKEAVGLEDPAEVVERATHLDHDEIVMDPSASEQGNA